MPFLVGLHYSKCKCYSYGIPAVGQKVPPHAGTGLQPFQDTACPLLHRHAGLLPPEVQMFAKNTSGLIPLQPQAPYIAVAGVSNGKGNITTLMPPHLESENLALATEGVHGLPPQWIFLTDALT